MKLKSTKKLRKRKSRTLLVLPVLDNISKSEENLVTMPKNPGLKLFTKTSWPPKSANNKENKNDNADDSGDTSRPLTATLEKPAVLDIRLLGKIDMSTVTKEFLNITNMCKFPVTFTINNKKKKSKTLSNRPLSLPATKKVSTKRNRKCDTSEDSWEDEESIKSAQIDPKHIKKHSKIKTACSNLTGSKADSKDLLFKISSASDPNNNNNSKTFKMPRKRIDNAGKLLNVKIELSGKSTKLPEPCKTCGRSNQPERFHSHPATPVRPPKKMEEPPKIPVKSTVQKPMAMKYKSKQTTESKVPVNRKPSLPAQKLVHTPPNLDNKEKAVLPAQKLVHTPMNTESKDLPVQKLVHTPPNVGNQTQQGDQKASVRVKSAKRTLTCYLCGREFGTASLPLHEPKCLEKWKRENANLPQELRRKIPQKPDHPMSQEEWDKFAWESSQDQLVPCNKCGRTFFPDRLVVHLRSCKDTGDTSSRSTKIKMTLEKARSIEAELQTAVTEEKDDVDLSNISFCQKVKLVLTNITVEPVLVLYILPCMMSSIATQNLGLEKACRVNLKLDPSICDAMAVRNSSGYTQADEELVHKYVASIIKYKSIIQSILPFILFLFIGSWSDRHKRRKPCMVLPIIGEFLAISGLMVCTYFFMELPLEANVFFESVPPAFCGGWFVMFMGLFSYMTSITTVETRTLRIGAVNLLSNVSITMGISLSGVIFKAVGFFGVFSLALSLYVFGIIYVCVFVKEKRSKEEEIEKMNLRKRNPVVDFFDFKHVVETFRSVFQHQRRNMKMRVIAVMVLAIVILGPVHGEMTVSYMYVRHRFQWNEIDYSLYNTFHFIVHSIGTVFSLAFFSRYLKLDDAILGIISVFSKLLACAIYAFAPSPVYFFSGAVVEILNGTSFIALRSIVTKLVDPKDIGRISSLFGLSETLAPIIYGPLYSVIYENTIDVLPGAFYIVGGFLTCPAIFIFFWLYRQSVIDKREAEEEENQKADENLLEKHEINEKVA